MRKEGAKERQTWIDVGKFVAVVAVMIDHTDGTLYLDSKIAWFSYYSVSLFVLLMGVNLYYSYKKTEYGFSKKIKQKVWAITKPYIVATFIYHLVRYSFFDLEIFLTQLIRFNASIPFYYVALHIQLLIISPLILRMLSKDFKIKGIIKELLGLVLVVIVSYFTTNYTNVLSIYGGGGKLLGGNYLVLLYIGMLIGKYSNFDVQKKRYLVISSIGFLLVTIKWWSFVSVNKLGIDSKIPFGYGFNPPSISLSLYAILLAITIMLVGKLLDNYKDSIFNKVWKIMGNVGRHSLYIFLYHRLFLDRIIPVLEYEYGIQIDNIWIKRIAYFGLMIGGSIIIEIVFNKCKKYCEDINNGL